MVVVLRVMAAMVALLHRFGFGRKWRSSFTSDAIYGKKGRFVILTFKDVVGRNYL
jgi:hypothetical protein